MAIKTPEEIANDVTSMCNHDEETCLCFFVCKPCIADAIRADRERAYRRAAEIAREPISDHKISVGNSVTGVCNSIASAIEREAALWAGKEKEQA